MGYTVKVPGSCGELIQGYLNSSNFLISCPIDIYSTVTVHKQNTKQIEIADNKDKTKRALECFLDYYQIKNTGLKVEINSNLPVLKGMGSSTADMSAAVIAAAKELNINLDLSLLQQILIEIEPSDATFLKGINLFDHIQGQKSRYLGDIKPIPLLVYDYGGKVDTLVFNQRKDLSKLNKDKAKEIEKAYNYIKKGIKQDNLEMIGKGATISSLANQTILPKRGLKELIQILKKQPGFLGINTAHSGTVIGIMVKEKRMFPSIIELLNEKTPKLKLLFQTQIINGGYQIRKEEG